jgi:Hint module
LLIFLDETRRVFLDAVRQSCTAAGDKCAGAPNFPLVPYTGCCDRTLVCGPRLQPGAGTWGAFCITTAEAAASTPAPPSSSSAAPATVAPTASAGTTAAPVAGATAAAGGATTVAATRASVTTAPSPSAAAPQPTIVPAPVVPVNATTTAPTTAAIEANATTPVPTVLPTTAPNDTALPNKTLPTPTPASNGSKCFPMTATVELESGATLSMGELSVGDVVKVGPNSYSKVFMFTHKMKTGDHSFVQLSTASGASISLTAGHYIPVEGSLVAASEVAVGALVQLGNGAVDHVVNVKTVSGTGLYNPQTLQGDIVVDGVVASTYTTAVEPRLAHVILSPFRAMSDVLGVNFAFLESGGGVLADVPPRGNFVL